MANQSQVLLGYAVGTGEPVHIPIQHMVVTGQTQQSGKTTTLEALISRSGLSAVAFVTKRNESAVLPPPCRLAVCLVDSGIAHAREDALRALLDHAGL